MCLSCTNTSLGSASHTWTVISVWHFVKINQLNLT